MTDSKKGLITPEYLTYIIVIAMIVIVLIIVFTFLVSKFGGGSFCLTRFQSNVGNVVEEASTIHGSSIVYMPLNIEDCVKDVYYRYNEEKKEGQICYIYVESGKGGQAGARARSDDTGEKFIENSKDCENPISTKYFRQVGYTSANVKFINCGDVSNKLSPDNYNVKITENTVECLR